MIETLPEPLVPADVDLRGLQYMPLFGERLFGSETWIAASAEAKVAALRLWWRAYAHELPAASLPDNDQLLAEYAGYGVAVKAWKRIRPQAMRGWTKCSDGRLYHKTVAEIALTSWESRRSNRARQEKWRARQRQRDEQETVTVTVTSASRNSRDGKGREGKGEENPSQAEASPPAPAREAAAAADDDLALPDFQRRTPGEVDEAFALWAAVAYDLRIPDVGYLNADRRQAMAARLAEIGGIEGWKLVLDRVREADFLREPDGRPKFWVGLSKLLEPETFSRLMEGRYAERHDPKPSAGGNVRANLAALAELAGESPG